MPYQLVVSELSFNDRLNRVIGGRLDNMYFFGSYFRYMGIVMVALFVFLLVYCTLVLSEILVCIYVLLLGDL